MKSIFYFVTLLSSSLMFSAAEVYAMPQQSVDQQKWDPYKAVETIYYNPQQKISESHKLENLNTTHNNSPEYLKNKAYYACLSLKNKSKKRINVTDVFLAIKNYLDTIKDDDSFLCYVLASLYQEGKGTSSNEDMAITYYTKAYKLGASKVEEAIHSLGLSLNSRGMDSRKKNDLKNAFSFFKKAADLINPPVVARFNLARCYESGVGTNQDLKKAFEIFQTLSVLESPQQYESLRKVAEFYNNGTDVKQDFEKAIEFYTKAEQLLKNDKEEQKKDLRSQLRELNLKVGSICEENAAEIQKNFLGSMYGYNTYNKIDQFLKKACLYYSQALLYIENKDERYQALCKLGKLYEGKIGDYEEAIKFYTEAERLLDDNHENKKELRNKLGDLNFKKGVRCEEYFSNNKDLEGALKFYEQAKLFGHPTVEHKIKACSLKLQVGKLLDEMRLKNYYLQHDPFTFLTYDMDQQGIKDVVGVLKDVQEDNLQMLGGIYKNLSDQAPFSQVDHLERNKYADLKFPISAASRRSITEIFPSDRPA